ncbi:CPCC family cysteine-rich protein [Rhizobium sp.]
MQLLPCPCCRLPTLEQRNMFDVCVVCFWEDDGQDDIHADEVWHGPNGDYSLARARQNFADHFHMFDDGKGIDQVENPNAARMRLLAYIRSRPFVAGQGKTGGFDRRLVR